MNIRPSMGWLARRRQMRTIRKLDTHDLIDWIQSLEDMNWNLGPALDQMTLWGYADAVRFVKVPPAVESPDLAHSQFDLYIDLLTELCVRRGWHG